MLCMSATEIVQTCVERFMASEGRRFSRNFRLSLRIIKKIINCKFVFI